MPALDQLTAPPAPGPGDLQVVRGVLLHRTEGPYARIDNRAALIGPVVGAGATANEQDVLIGFDQDGRPWVIATDPGMEQWVENVRDYGAQGDNATDDGPAIQRAIDAAALSGKRVWFPLGRYLTRQELRVTNGTYLMGNGASSVIALAPNLPGNLDLISVADREAGCRNVTIANLTLDGDKAHQTPSFYTTILQLWRVQNLLLQDLVVTGGLIEGVYVFGSDAPRIVNCTASGNGNYRADASGFHLEQCTRPVVSGCVADSNGFHGFILTGTTDGTFTACRAKGNGFDGARVQYNSDRNRWIGFLSASNFRGIYFTTASTLNEITDSTLIDAEASGLVYNAAPKNIARGVHVQNCNHAVETVDATDVEYGFGNTFRASRAGDLALVAGSSFTALTGAYLNV